MTKLIIILSAIFEFLFYTFLMVLIDGINITNQIVDLLIHFLGLIIVSFIFYNLLQIIFKKINMKAKKYIYYVIISNLILTLIVPVLMIIIIPNELLTSLSFLILISAIYYGIFINLTLIFLNYFFTNMRKKP